MSDAQAHITEFWRTIASGYETHGGNVAPYGTAAYQHWVEALAGVLPAPPADVLDVATGTGYVALTAASLGHRVTAIDLSAPMLDELRAHATERSLIVSARRGDAVVPEFPVASFDAVTNRHLLRTLREPQKALANWLALLRPGGRLVAIDGFWFTSSDEAPPLFDQHYTPATREQLPLMHLDHPDPILEMLTAVGFVEVTAAPRPDLALEGGVPYFFTGQRP
jgi:ubiquinone/menaquinone biosynthesis C-methylase UbiE